MIGKLNTIPLENVNGVGKTRKIIFNSHKIYSTYDLVTIIPKNYHDYIISDIKNAKNGEIISVVGSIHDSISIIKGKTMYKISFLLSCKNEDVDIILFRSEVGFYNNFKKGDNVLVKGKYFFYERKIIANEIKKYNENTKKIIPIYKIETLPDSIIQEIIETIFKEKKVTIIENLPKKLLLKNNIISREQMYKNLHCPLSFSDIDSSIYRLKYEEALLMEYDIISKRRTLKREKITFDMTKVKHFISKIGFELTSEQKEATNSIFRLINKENVFYHLLQGDVGSGKTIVAIIASYAYITSLKQVAYMTPTVLLANQIFDIISKYYLEYFKPCLLTSNTKNISQVLEKIKNNEYNFIIGTSSLINDSVVFNSLGLTILDEEQRFGVNTRLMLENKNIYSDALYLSATPIPQTLALSYFSNISISSIKTKPHSATKVTSKYIDYKDINIVYEKIKEESKNNNHIIVVAPSISSNTRGTNIKKIYDELKKELDIPIFVIHGELKNSEIDSIYAKYLDTLGSILLSTSIVEVGIDIKSATVMVIMDASYFGLSQLHQIRGRVGRGTKDSICYFVDKNNNNSKLKFMEQNNDAFMLSEFDLKERGPGDFIKDIQSGYHFKYLNFYEDLDIIKTSIDDVNLVINEENYKTNKEYYIFNKKEL